MKFFNTCWIIAVLMAGPAALHAGGCRNVAVVHRNNVVVKDIVKVVDTLVVPAIARFVPFALEVPTYNTQFYGAVPYGAVAPYAGHAPAAVAPCVEKNDKVLQKLQDIDQRLQSLEGGGVTPVPSARPKTPAPMEKADQEVRAPGGSLLALATSRCASCHADGQKKGGFTMLQGGQLVNLSEEQLGNIIDRLSTDDPKKQMPPAGGMSAAEKLKMVSLLVNGK